ncbi:MAG: triose-phosphate isomerase [Nitrososphaerales archaeon]
MRKLLFIVNFKNYTEISGEKSVKLAQSAASVAKDTKVKIAVAPPQASLALLASQVRIPVFAQHLDHSNTGSTTGFMVPEMAKSYGVGGSLINHSEHRIQRAKIKQLVKKLRKLRMVSVVCARSPHEVKKLASFKPDYIAIEPPELIGSGIAVSKAKPSVITRSINVANHVNAKVNVICGAGILDASDVSAAIRLGSRGILVASGIVKSRNWRAKIRELANAMVI